MKALLASSLFLLGGIAAAQNAPAASLQLALQRPGENSFAQLAPRSHLIIDRAPRSCAYIHSFIFERNDGEAPKFVKETYCTPTGQFAVKRASKPGLYSALLKPEAPKPPAE